MLQIGPLPRHASLGGHTALHLPVQVLLPAYQVHGRQVLLAHLAEKQPSLLQAAAGGRLSFLSQLLLQSPGHCTIIDF